jgi:hypothetical protein
VELIYANCHGEETIKQSRLFEWKRSLSKQILEELGRSKCCMVCGRKTIAIDPHQIIPRVLKGLPYPTEIIENPCNLAYICKACKVTDVRPKVKMSDIIIPKLSGDIKFTCPKYGRKIKEIWDQLAKAIISNDCNTVSFAKLSFRQLIRDILKSCGAQ